MSNNFYNATGKPGAASRGLSADLRAEFLLTAAGFLGVQDVATAMITGAAIYAVDTGAVNAYAVTVGTVDAASYISAYTDGLMIRFRTSNANTSASTLNVNGLGAITIVRSDGSPLQTGDILASNPAMVMYNASAGQFYLNMGAAGASGAASVSGTSTTSNPIPASTGGSISFTYVEASRTVSLGMFILAVVTASPTTNWVELQVTAWNASTKVVTGTVVSFGGTGTYAAWTLSLAGAVGAQGAAGNGAGANQPASGAMTLTKDSIFDQYGSFTAHGQPVNFPDATTMTRTGIVFNVDNPTQWWGQARDFNGKLIGLLPPMSSTLVRLADTSSSSGKWAMGGPLVGMIGQLALSASLLGNINVKLVPIWMDTTHTVVLVGGTNLYAVAFNRGTGQFGTALLVRSSIGSAGTFSGIKSATNQVLAVSVDGTTGMEAVTITFDGSTGLTLNSGTKGTATLAGNVNTTFTPNTDTAGLRPITQYDASTFLVPYSRAASLGGLRAITISGTTPSIGAESTLGNLAGGTAHIHLSGTMILAISGGSANTAYCFTVAGNALTATGNVALGVATQNFFKSLPLGTRWAVVSALSGNASSSAGLISVAAGVPTATNVASVTTSTAGTDNTALDVQVCNGKLVVCNHLADAAGTLKMNVLTDTAGTISKGTELSAAFGASADPQSYNPLAAGTTGTDALFWWSEKMLRISAAAASATLSAINLGSCAVITATAGSNARLRNGTGRSNARSAQLLYSGNLAVVLAANAATTADQDHTTAFATNASDAAPFRTVSPHACLLDANLACGVPTGSQSETWIFNQNSTAEPATLSCFEAIQP